MAHPTGNSTAAPLLSIRHVSKTFTIRRGRSQVSTHALADISLDVSEGEFVAVIGASGSGKSTLLRLIDGLDTPSGGEILLGGQPVTSPGPDRGVVFQHPRLMPWRTVRRNVEFGLECNGVGRAERSETASKVLELVGLTGFEDHYPAQLSGGMQQRVGIARAYAVSPSMLLLDEPFGALDAQTRVVLQQDLEQLWQAQRKTTILITHDMEEAVYLAGRVVVMGNRPGRVVDVIDVPFDRPRGYDLRGTAEFGALKTRLWHALQKGMADDVA
ncbi:ABC transporter ATP-binding protein [Mycobacterium sp. djl-10]|nr:ABC transporter ATP-binding protein [Mycobacterium sp. djl-10]